MSSASVGDGSGAFLFSIPSRSWLFALRTWAAMMTALYAAFWLQLESASSAAVCVGILALQTRGQAYEKALYRLGGTVLGVAVSIAITGLFNGERDLFFLAVAAWMGACAYVSSLSHGNRAYGAVLSGYTVAIVAVANVDTPQNVFDSGMARGAAIIIGIVSVMLYNDLFSAPTIYTDLLNRLEGAHRRVIALVCKILRDGPANPEPAIEQLRLIVALRPDITALPTESIAGRARAAAASAATVAMAREVASARAVGAVLQQLGARASGIVEALSTALREPWGAEASALVERIDTILETQDAGEPLFVAAGAARILIDQNRRTQVALDDLRHDRGPLRGPRLQLFRARQAALRNGLRVFVAILVGATFFIVTGWPSTAFAMVLLGATVGLSTNAPSPRQFAKTAMIAMPTAFAVTGVVEFLILDGVDAFPLLALGLAPVVVGASLLVASGNPRFAPIGSLLLVFVPVLLAPSNPQSYDPQTYLTNGSLAVIATFLLFIVLATVLPTSEDLTRTWILRSLRADFNHALFSARWRHEPDEIAFRHADRIAQLGVLHPSSVSDHGADLRHAMRWASLTSAAWRVRTAIAHPCMPPGVKGEGRAALTAEDPAGLRKVANRMQARRGELTEADLHARRWAAASLALMATLIEISPIEIAELTEEGPV